jgi:hypothetical protein
MAKIKTKQKERNRKGKVVKKFSEESRNEFLKAFNDNNIPDSLVLIK